MKRPPHRSPASGREQAALARNQVRLSMPFAAGDLQALELRDHMALADLRSGCATDAAITVLRMSATISVGLCDLGYAPDAAPAARAVAAALDQAGPGQSDPATIHCVAQLIELWAAQRRAAPRGRVLQAAGVLRWR